MPELEIGGILLAPIIMLVIQVLKYYGLSSDLAPYANIVLSAVAGIVVLLTQSNPELVTPVVFILQVITLFLGAAGSYTTGKWVKTGIANRLE
jgi:hypothetical protein